MKTNRERIRTAVISHGFIPRVGGIESLLASLLPALRERAIDPVLITRRLPGTPAYEEMRGVPVYRVPASGPKPTAALMFMTAALCKIYDFSPDLVHAHEFISPSSTALLARFVFGVPFIVTPHLGGPIGDIHKLEGSFLGRWRLNQLRKQASAFQVISDEIGRELDAMGVPSARQVAIRNGVDTNRFRPPGPGAKRERRRKLGLGMEDEVLLFAGRLVPMKRLDLVLEAWSLIRKSHPKAVLVIVGEGPLEVLIQQSGQEGIRFLGSQDDMVPFLQAADVLMMPSDSEGLPMMLLESMACGVPAAVTPVGGIPQVVQDHNTGMLVKTGDAHYLAKTVSELLEDRNLRAALGAAARQRIVGEYGIDRTADQLADLYRDICRRESWKS